MILSADSPDEEELESERLGKNLLITLDF